ncbi:LAETG motif-containing sortase-dependent surface protein [Streptomyces cylindrosporus]|uniref:LPXTG cell wall anchor domain-containing protein n=1 Tax=Streptomyces cylindrosporus TaxID=2927583 RepID=A0ABS9YFT7_9ACTN|nr:LAETG motif-containing sortase-dependent surface protein [Streptomyces cylindrosporus]MCI3276092.1 LPXTG cell wall anchor domain-containing protein [Streptomyces cylindrosporus]
MKLRRAMGVAAATAVLAPLALLSAPVAFATDETPDTSTSSPATDESTPAADDTTPAADDTTPAADDTTPAADDTTPAAEDTTPAAGDTTPAADDTTPAAAESSSSATPTPSASETAPEDGGELCVDDNGDSTAELSADLKSGLSGLPETIVAGGGWTAFSFNVSNKGDEEIKDIKPLIGVAAIGWEDEKDYSGEIQVQVFDKSSKTWQTIADAAGEGGTFPAFSLSGGQSVSYQLRLKVSGKVPDSLGLTGGLAEYQDEEGCWVADDPNGWIYFFDILAAGSDAGNPDDAKPQTGGMKPLEDVSDVDATGSLAETGSSSALPMIALTGGAAVALGGGAVFAVRRRRAGTHA